MKYRKTRRHKQRQKKIIIVSCLSLLLFLCAGYAAFSTNLNIKAKGNIKEQTRVIQAWNKNSQTDFHSDFYRENIISVTFLDNNNVPNNATERWNVSEDKENGGVMAYVVSNSSDNTKYDLYIGAKGGVIANEDSSFLFYGFTNITSIDFSNNFDTSNVITMNSMFYSCEKLIELDLSNFDTRNVTDMSNLFKWCYDLSELNISSFNTENATTMALMFYYCQSLTKIDLSNFDTRNVTSMSYMFEGCSGLMMLDVSGFNTSKVTDMSFMFKACTSLTSLNVSNFDTSNVTNMQDMFNGLTITTLDISNFDTRKVTNMYSMFMYASNLTTIYVGENWTTENAQTYQMFTNCGTSTVTHI